MSYETKITWRKAEELDHDGSIMCLIDDQALGHMIYEYYYVKIENKNIVILKKGRFQTRPISQSEIDSILACIYTDELITKDLVDKIHPFPPDDTIWYDISDEKFKPNFGDWIWISVGEDQIKHLVQLAPEDQQLKIKDSVKKFGIFFAKVFIPFGKNKTPVMYPTINRWAKVENIERYLGGI